MNNKIKSFNLNYIKMARVISNFVGKPSTFTGALIIILLWLTIGPLFEFSNTYQLIINTFTTIITFLMVFIIQNTQNWDTRALHMKLDELLRVSKGARKTLINIQEKTGDIAEEIEEIAEDIEEIQQVVAEEEDANRDSPTTSS